MQVRHASLQAALEWILEQVPIHAPGFAPFVTLAEVEAHEKQLLAGVAEHVGVEQAECGELLPRVARNLVQHARFAVDDLIM